MCQIYKLICLVLITILSVKVTAQETRDFAKPPSYSIKKSQHSITINGIENEKEWQEIPGITRMYNHSPIDTGFAAQKTEIKMTYDDTYIYIIGKCYDNGKRIIQTLQRDNTGFYRSDHLAIAIDPIKNKQNGFFFGVNAGGAQFESSLSYNGTRTSSFSSWDNKWISEVKQYPNYWLVEMAIPLSSLRFNKGDENWNINFMRYDASNNTIYTWRQFPLNFQPNDLNYMGNLKWDKSIVRSSKKYNIIPYSTINTSRDYQDTEQNSSEKDLKVGVDAKIALTSSLNLDITLNPDFSNADVDQQVTNITRFSIFLPERRNFFLENDDIFSNFGGRAIRPFFSRKIGLDNGTVVPLKYGARISGNINKSTRIGVMNIQASKQDELEAQNFTVAAVQKQVLDRSVIKGIFISKQQTGSDAPDSYSRNYGVELGYGSKNGSLNNTFRIHSSHTNENLGDNLYYGFSGNYVRRRFRSGWTLDVVGKNFIPDVGINPRLENYNAETEETIRIGFLRFNPYARYIFFPKNPQSKLNWHGVRSWHEVHLNDDNSLNETENNIAYDFNFKNSSWLSIDYQFRKVNLPVPTSFLGEFEALPAESFSFSQIGAEYDSDNRKRISTSSRVSYGTFYNGTRLNLVFRTNLRFQPWGNFGVSYRYNDIRLADNYGQRELHLLRFNGNISFSNKMFLTNVVQLNSQNENLSVFSRFQWRYKPMSDLFIIFNKNYNSDDFKTQNQGLIIKLTYWF